MLLCGLEGSGFIIAVGLTLLMAGVIIYYVNARLRGLHAAVEKQGTVLSQLINDVRSHVGGSMGLATPEAQAAAMEFATNQEGRSELIPVSDDDSEETDEYDSSSEEEEEVAAGPVAISLDEPKSASGVELSVNGLSGLRVIEADIHAGIVPEVANLSPGDDSMSDDGESSDGSERDSLIETLNPGTMEAISTLTVNKIDGANSETIELAQDSSDLGESTIKGMRVNQLRDLAMHRKQVPESEAKSMKKPELLQLLLGQ
tara:strand:- start:4098 stop:4874 length:777 start_codon:yes stop_codon:yes gene_type:complete